jgi:plasmid stabilization system protein ParE
MRVFVRESAEADLDHIAEWIAKDNPAAARPGHRNA